MHNRNITKYSQAYPIAILCEFMKSEPIVSIDMNLEKVTELLS